MNTKQLSIPKAPRFVLKADATLATTSLLTSLIHNPSMAEGVLGDCYHLALALPEMQGTSSTTLTMEILTTLI